MTKESWPPWCCVPAFVRASSAHLGFDLPSPKELARSLGVRVAVGSANPFGLRSADACHPPGIVGLDAEREVNRLYAALELPIRLRRIPYNTIANEGWDEVLETALARGSVVGVGLHYGVLTGGSAVDASAWHVLRVLSAVGRTLTLWDDSGESDPVEMRVDRIDQERATRAIGDGLWIVGLPASLSFTGSLPWRD